MTIPSDPVLRAHVERQRAARIARTAEQVAAHVKAKAARREEQVPGEVTTDQEPDAPWGRCGACEGTKLIAAAGYPTHYYPAADDERAMECPTCSGTGRALPADREAAFLRELAGVWAGLGMGRMERLYAGPVWAEFSAPVAARLILRAAREAHALGLGSLLDAAVGQGEDAARSWTWLAAELSAGRYEARPERDLPVLRLVWGLKGEAGEVLRRWAQRDRFTGDENWPAVHAAFDTLGPILSRDGGSIDRGLRIARALWGGCERGGRYWDPTTHRQADDGRCTLVAGHAGGCRFEGGEGDGMTPARFRNLTEGEFALPRPPDGDA